MSLTRRSLVAAVLAARPLATAYAARRTLTIAGPAGTFHTGYDAAVLEPFRRRNPGLDVTYFPAATSEQIIDVLRLRRASPPIDVALMDITEAATATDRKLLVPLTRASLSGVELPDSVFTEDVAGPAVMLDSLALVYSPRKLQPPPTTWRVLWDKNLARQLFLPAPPDWAGVAFVLVANAVYGGDDYRQSLEAGINAIRIIAPGVVTWYPIPDVYQAIIEGAGAIGVAWNAEGQLIARNSPGRLAMAMPVEGSIFRVTTINLTTTSANPEAARDFITYALSAEAQQAMAAHLFYTPVNPAAKLDPATLARTEASAEQLARMMDVDWLDVARMRERVTRDWRLRIMTGR